MDWYVTQVVQADFGVVWTPQIALGEYFVPSRW